jgi:hypothetical protein
MTAFSKLEQYLRMSERRASLADYRRKVEEWITGDQRYEINRLWIMALSCFRTNVIFRVALLLLYLS